MRDLSQEVVSKIREEHILPEPKWRVFLHTALFWAVMAVMLFLGTIAASLVIFNVADVDIRFFRHLPSGKFLVVFFATVPYIWLAFATGAIVFGVLAFRKTKYGYRFRILFVTSVAVLAVLVLGAVGHAAHVGDRVRGMAGPGLHGITDMRGQHWQRPEDGLVAGEVTGVGVQRFDLQSFDGASWVILTDGDTEYIDGITPLTGDRVGVIGEKTGDFSMRAFSVKMLPFRGEENLSRVPMLRRGDGDADDRADTPPFIRD